MGGTSTLEMYAIADEPQVFVDLTNFLKSLAIKFGIKLPSRIFVGVHGFNQSGFSLALLNLTHVAKSTSSKTSYSFLLTRRMRLLCGPLKASLVRPLKR